MDCKLEPAARSLMRIEVLAAQGIVRSIVLFLIGVLISPFYPLFYVVGRFVSTRLLMPWWKRVVFIPAWMFLGVVIAIVSPFGALWNTISTTVSICRLEWVNRWLASEPKNPDGSPMYIPTERERQLMDFANTYSVLRDYNEEAKEHGQGIDIPPLS